jgi:hypothetical protein
VNRGNPTPRSIPIQDWGWDLVKNGKQRVVFQQDGLLLHTGPFTQFVSEYNQASYCYLGNHRENVIVQHPNIVTSFKAYSC